jgi:flagellar basal-body rod protein FlgB
MDIFSVASRHANWIAQRQSVVARNIANVDTPGFKAKDVTPFALQADPLSGQILATQPRHFGILAVSGTSDQAETMMLQSRDVSHSGNSVSLEMEMKKVGENTMAYGLDMSLVKLFHRMTMMSLKG